MLTILQINLVYTIRKALKRQTCTNNVETKNMWASMHAWFLKITFVQKIDMYLCVCVCVCVCPPSEANNN